MKKVSIIGAGNVGSTVAFYLAKREIAEIVLIDIVEGLPNGKALDIAESTPLLDSDIDIQGTTDFSAIKGSDIIVITAGVPRKAGMSRLDLLKVNAEIVKSVIEKVIQYAADSIIIMVTNPLDVMTYYAYKLSKFPANRVFGQAGVLDSTRFRYFVAKELQVSIKDVCALVMGGHGDEMIPLPRYTTVGGIPITELLPKEKIDILIERTRKGGTEIVSLLKTGSAFYAPAVSVAEMAEAVIKNKKRVMPVSAYLQGEYGLSDIYFGVPAKLGANGVEQIIELKLTEEELNELQKTAQVYKDTIALLEL